MPNDEMISAFLDGDITDAQHAELTRWLKSDPANIRRFAEFGMLHAQLADHFSVQRKLEQMPAIHAAKARPWWWIAVATVSAAAAVLAVLLYRSGQSPPIQSFALSEVRIDDLGDAAWADAKFNPAPGDRLPPGTIQLSSGLVKLTLGDGNVLVVQGPSQFAIGENQTIVLDRGQLLAKSVADSPAISIKTGQLTILSRNAELGVRATSADRSEVMIYRGTAQMIADARPGEAEQISAPDAATIISQAITRVPGTAVAAFTRDIPKRDFLDIQDLLAGGDGSGSAQSGGIDVASADLFRGEQVELGRPTERPGSKRYLPIGNNALDGCFTPNGSATVDSSGHLFEFPPTNGNVCGLVFAGAQVRDTGVATRLGSVDYGRWPHRALLIPSNSGITINLDAIRKMHSGKTLTRFKATVGNSFSRERTNGPSADVFVLLDGVRSFEKRNFTPATGNFDVQCPIDPGNRFLTLVTTDGGDGTGNDWIIWGDSAIEFQPANNP